MFNLEAILLNHFEAFESLEGMVVVRTAIQNGLAHEAKDATNITLTFDQIRRLAAHQFNRYSGQPSMVITIIKEVRAEYGIGLKEAKDVVDPYRNLFNNLRDMVLANA
jgi:ribosomal protein L7/L12